MSDDRQTHVFNVPAGTRATVSIESDDAQRGRRGPGWFRMFRPVVRRRIWANFSASAKAVYPVLAERCDEDWVAQVPFEQPRSLHGTDERLGLVELSGQSRSGVNRAMKELKRKGLLIVRVDGRGRNCGVYQLVPPLVVDAPKHATGDTLNMPPVAHSRVTGDTFKVPPVAPLQNIERGRESLRLSLETAAAGAARNALQGKGVGEPALSELVAAGLTVELLQAVASRMRPGKGVGALILDLRAELRRQPGLREERERRIERERTAAAEQQREAAELAEERRADAAWVDRLTRMDPADRAAMVQALVARPGCERYRRPGANLDPLTNVVLRAMLWTAVDRGELVYAPAGKSAAR